MSEATLLDMQQVCDFLDLKEVTVKRYVREGLLDGLKQDGQLLFEPEKVNRFKSIQEKLGG